jgi:uncharacterized protein (TIGR03000 family)
MYSMVMMMAMSTSPEAVACHGCNGGGCSGVVASGCNGGCHGGGLFGGCHGGGLFGGCHGGGGCSGCHGGGLFGGCFRKHGCNGCNGCSGAAAGCSGGAGCSGTVVPAPAPEPEKKEMPKKGGVTFAPVAPAYITVNVPADAKVTIDGAATRSTSEVRVFATPNLNPGAVSYYTFVAEVVRDGKTYTATEKVAVEAGARPVITLNPNVGPAIASK